MSVFSCVGTGVFATNVVLRDAGAAATGALSNVVGAAVMQKAGHTGYSLLSATRNGALGGCVLGAVPAVYEVLRPAQEERSSFASLAAPFLFVGGSAAAGAVGSAILDAAGSAGRQAVGRSAVSGAVGAAVLAGAALVVGGIGFAAIFAFQAVGPRSGANKDADVALQDV